MRNLIAVVSGLIVVIISNYIGHYAPPFSISVTPMLIIAISITILYFSEFRLIVKTLYILFFIVLNDILIRFFAGGTHDWEGLDWVELFMSVGIIITLIVLIISPVNSLKTNKKEKRISIVLYIIILTGYTYYFETLGMIYTNNPIEKIGLAKAQNLFISEINYSDSLFVYRDDTFKFKTGWIEKQTRTNHYGLIKRIELTGNYEYIIPMSGKFDSHGYNLNIYFNANEKNYSGASPIDTLLSFETNSLSKEVFLSFFSHDSNGFNLLKEIQVTPAN